MIRALFRKPLFWAIFALISISCAALAAQYASRALPVVSVNIRMDRGSALDAAVELGEKNSWGPSNPRRAAVFRVDTAVQSFVELGGGGTEEFRKMVEGDLYSPYQWQVRLYKEGTNNEALVHFTPQGEPYGFFEKIPEDDPGPALTSDDARRIAEETALDWPVDLAAFDLIQTSDETRPSGRVDHSFVYERREAEVGREGTYRLRLSVSGDQLNVLHHFVRIPESFTRSYEELRSANNTISTAAFFAAAVLFGFGGLGFGLFFLLRRHLLVWKKPAIWGAIVAGGMAATQLNDIPLAEIAYDTAVSREAFIFQQVASALGSFVGMFVVFSVVFMGAEGLTRVAFPRHLQLWRLWSRGTAGTKQVLGRTLAGYLVLGVDMALLVGFYLFARSKLGWYVPSSFPVDPNVLATYAPWLPPIAISLYAALIEESIFRAVPIASAILLGRHFGKTQVWVVGAFILQAVVFGAAHANYDAQPAYARLVELIVPSLFFGLLYYFFGLLPAVILHFSVDVAFFSIPLFATTAQGVWISRGVVISLALIPLWVSLVGIVRGRGLKDASPVEYNASWSAAQPVERIEKTPPAARPFSTRFALAMIGAGIFGVVLYRYITDLTPEVPALQIDRTAAIEIATRTLREEGFTPDDAWERLATVYGSPGTGDLFVWRTSGEEVYRRLIGTYLAPPHYKVRFARFSGELVQTAEEWVVAVQGSGSVRQITHKLPETAPGSRLTETSARVIALKEVADRFALSGEQVQEVSAVETNRPARGDWTFVFRDPSIEMRQGEARIRISIAGEDLSDYDRFVHVPDAWSRMQRSRSSIAGTIETLCYGGFLLAFLAGLILSISGMVRHRFDQDIFVRSFLVLAALSLGAVLNSWPALRASLSTAQPVSSQLFVALGGSVLSLLVISSGLSVLIGYLTAANRPRSVAKGLHVTAAAGLGLLIATVISFVTSRYSAEFPNWPNMTGSGEVIPIFNLNSVRFFVIIATTAIFVSSIIHKVTAGWAQRRVLAAGMLLISGLLLSGVFGIVSISGWLISGLGIAAVLLMIYLTLFIRDPSLVPIAIAVYLSIPALRQALFGAFPGAEVSRSIQIMAMLGLAFAWAAAFRGQPQAQDDEE